MRADGGKVEGSPPENRRPEIPRSVAIRDGEVVNLIEAAQVQDSPPARSGERSCGNVVAAESPDAIWWDELPGAGR